jgi:uncharacterized protein (DUF1800 family)
MGLAQSALAQQPPQLDLLRPLAPQDVTEEKLRYLADKAGFGLGADEREVLRMGQERGIQAAVTEFMRAKPEACNTAGNAQLFGIPEDQCFDQYVAQQLEVVAGTGNSNDRRRALESLTGFRFVNSANAYEQRMFVHLLGLFTTSLQPETLQGKAAEMSSYVELLRAAAAGDAALVALAKDVTKHPMMLNFLSGNGSKAPQPNENYGREFQGLMAVGTEDLAGNLTYTDEDVVEASKAFTGFVVEGREARFVEANFIPGPKVLYRGQPHECTAVTADDAVECAFQHPNASIHCAQELLRSFVTPDPSDALVQELAAVCKANDFKLRPTMEVLLASRAFYDAANVDTIPKQCYEIYTGMVRSAKLPVAPDDFGRALSRCNDGNVLASPGALFFEIDAPTNPLTKIDVTDFLVARLGAAAGSYDADAAISRDKIEKALFTDKGIAVTASAEEAFNSCTAQLGLAGTLSSEQRSRYLGLFDPAAYDSGSREQRIDAMLGCYRRFLLSTEYGTR